MSDDDYNCDNNYSCEYSSPSYDNYCESYSTGEQDTSTYTYTAIPPEVDWTEQHEITTLSYTDTQYKVAENDSMEDLKTSQTANVNSQFQRDCHALDRVDNSIRTLYEDVCGYSAAPRNNRTGERDTITIPREDTATSTCGGIERTEELSRTVPTGAGPMPEYESANGYDVSIPIRDIIERSEVMECERAREFDLLSPASRITMCQQVPRTVILGQHNYAHTTTHSGHTPSNRAMSQYQTSLQRNEETTKAANKCRCIIIVVTLAVFFTSLFIIVMSPGIQKN